MKQNNVGTVAKRVGVLKLFPVISVLRILFSIQRANSYNTCFQKTAKIYFPLSNLGLLICWLLVYLAKFLCNKSRLESCVMLIKHRYVAGERQFSLTQKIGDMILYFYLSPYLRIYVLIHFTVMPEKTKKKSKKTHRHFHQVFFMSSRLQRIISTQVFFTIRRISSY